MVLLLLFLLARTHAETFAGWKVSASEAIVSLFNTKVSAWIFYTVCLLLILVELRWALCATPHKIKAFAEYTPITLSSKTSNGTCWFIRQTSSASCSRTEKKMSVPESIGTKENSARMERSRIWILRSTRGLRLCLNKQNDGLRESEASIFRRLCTQRHYLPSKSYTIKSISLPCS